VVLAARRHVEVHPLVERQPRHGPAQERLGRVVDARAERGDRLAAPSPEMVLVVHEQRRAEALGQRDGIATG
jgi:hypothetical protein